MARLLPLLCAALPALAARGEGFDIAGSIGLAYGASQGQDDVAPGLALRASYGGPIFSAGLNGLFAVGSAASYRGGGERVDSSGLQAWAALADVSVQTPGTVSVGVRTGAGLGKVISLNCNCEEVAPAYGHVAPAFFGSAFASARVGDQTRIVLELSGVHFDNLEHGGAPFSAPATGLEAWIFALAVGVQWGR
jgi:hypothetical protein